MIHFAISPLFAIGGQAIEFLIVFVIVIVGSVLRKIAEERERAARAKSAKRPTIPPTTYSPTTFSSTTAPSPTVSGPAKRDNQFRTEIEAFLEEVGRRRPAGASGTSPSQQSSARQQASGEQRSRDQDSRDDQPRVRPPARPEPTKMAPAAKSAGSPTRGGEEPKRPAQSAGSPRRPGSEMSARKAPVSQDLGSQVRTHLEQYLDPKRLSEQVRADVGNSVERTLREHLGETMTRGTEEQNDRTTAVAAVHPLILLLREPAGVRTAMMINEVLGPPKGLRRKTGQALGPVPKL